MPIACLRNERTMTILVKELMRSRMAGAKARIVRSKTILIRFLLPSLPVKELITSILDSVLPLLVLAFAEARAGTRRIEKMIIPIRNILTLPYPLSSIL